MSSEANIVKDLIDRGMAPIRADLDRFAAGMRSMSAQSENPPPAAVKAVRAAREHAAAAHTSLTTAHGGHIRLLQGGSQALATFFYLGQGLTILERALTSKDTAAILRLTADAKALIHRANDELRAADRALGCPYGCRKAPPMPKIGARP